MAEKFCIFCGNKPKDKNMEHVIPQWLIKIATCEKKDVFAQFSEHSKHLTFMNYKFPACEACNTKYSHMEADVKPIVEKVLSGGTILGQEASLLMDWFDKLRIGLWLTEMCYDKHLRVNVQPHMFIDSRVGRKDRLLSIQKLDLKPDEKNGILFYGTATPWFNFAPCAFVMVINDYYFFNASMDCLLSQRMGFPYVVSPKIIDKWDSKYTADILKGANRVVSPIVQTYLPNQNSITFYQPIFKDYINFNNVRDTYLKNDYVLKHSYDAVNGLGGVFVQHGNKANIRYLNKDDKVGIHLHERSIPCIQEEGLKFQIAIGKKALTPNNDVEQCLKMNELLLAQIQQNIR